MQKKLDELVREYLIESGDTSEHRYARLLTIAISGLRVLHTDVSGVPKLEPLTLSDVNTANLPADYISYTKIGICGVDGNFHTLGWNPKMCTPRDYDDCGDLTTENAPTSTTNVDGDVLIIPFEGGLVRNGEVLGRMYGLGGGNNSNGYYKIDERNRVICFQNLRSTDVWLEYLADIEEINGDYYVHIYDEESLKAWIYWKDIERNRTYGGGEKEQARKSFVREKKIAQRRHKSFTMDEAKQIGRRANKQSVKF